MKFYVFRHFKKSSNSFDNNDGLKVSKLIFKENWFLDVPIEASKIILKTIEKNFKENIQSDQV